MICILRFLSKHNNKKKLICDLCREKERIPPSNTFVNIHQAPQYRAFQKLFKNANNIITKLYEFTIKEISNFVYIFCVHMFLIYC